MYIHWASFQFKIRAGTLHPRTALVDTAPPPAWTSVICIHFLTAAAKIPIFSKLLTPLAHHSLDNIPMLISFPPFHHYHCPWSSASSQRTCRQAGVISEFSLRKSEGNLCLKRRPFMHQLAAPSERKTNSPFRCIKSTTEIKGVGRTNRYANRTRMRRSTFENAAQLPPFLLWIFRILSSSSF